MDDGGHRDNGRHKAPPQGQWMMQHQPSMKQVMSIIAERDAAIQERNLAISDRKSAVAERDMTFLQRDTAIAERNNAIMERDNALSALQYRENSMSSPASSAVANACPSGCQMPRGVKHIHHPQMHHHQHHMLQLSDQAYDETREMDPNDGLPTPGTALESAKPKCGKRVKDPKATTKTTANKRGPKNPRKVKKENEDDLTKIMFVKTTLDYGEEATMS